MKLPYGPILGPFFKQNSAQIQFICKPCIFGSKSYLLIFSFVALIVTIFDIIRLIGRGFLSPTLFKSLDPKVCPILLKNSKLVGSTINAYTYFYLLQGIIKEHSVFLMPYLFLQLVNIFLLAILLSVAVCTNWNNLEKKNLPLFVFMIHNWLQVFCFFRSCLHINDF